jgi:uncharacterized protein (TIGR03000 family)
MSKQGVSVWLGAALLCVLPSVASAQDRGGFYSPYYYLRHGSYYEPNFYGSARTGWDSNSNYAPSIAGPEYSPYDYLRHGTYTQPGYSGRSTPSYSYTPSYYYSPSTVRPMSESARAASVDLRVPANAEVWVDGSLTSQRGEARTFQTAPFAPGQSFTYDIRARWKDAGGKEVDQTRQVSLQAGQNMKVDFTAPEGAKPMK